MSQSCLKSCLRECFPIACLFKDNFQPTCSESLRCPACHTAFQSPATLAVHLNHAEQPCSLLGKNEVPYPIPPAFYTKNGEDVTGYYHQTSGLIYGRGETILDKMKMDEYERRREHAMYYPFEDEAEWDLAKFLVRHLNQSEINKFLRLKWVSLVYIIRDPFTVNS